MAFRKIRKKLGCLTVIVALVLVAAAVVEYFVPGGVQGLFGEKTAAPVEGEAVFHFIDVGQADAALICTSDGNVLIDAGMQASEADLKAYLKAQGIETIDYAVFTHPHEDHIGGADMVMKNFDVKNVILPDKTATTKTYTNMMEAIEESGAKVITAKPDATYSVGDLKLTVLAPIKGGYSDLNNYSVVVRVDFGGASAMFTGDAEGVSEEEMLSRYGLSGKLDCDLLKVGHHGSKSSTTQAFLDQVSPSVAVISCGKGNDYGHPETEILNRLDKKKITYYRTDLEGSIVFSTDGEAWTKK